MTHQPYASLQLREFRLYLLGRLCLTMAWQMQGVIVSWQVYELTKDAFALGLVGLSEAIPFILICPLGGHAADIISRKKLIIGFTVLYFLCAIALLVMSVSSAHSNLPLRTGYIYLVIGVTGVARSFLGPAIVSFLAQITPRHLYLNAVTWNSNVWHMAAVSGPAAGGLIYGFAGITASYSTVAALMLLSMILFSFIRKKPMPKNEISGGVFENLTAGIRFVFKNQILIGALGLDMLAVFFGGAAAMLPVFAADILHTGPEGLGILRAAPFAGSVLMGLILAHQPPMKRAGRNLILAFVGFGICTICFALSKNFFLSLFLLFLTGAFDNISVIVRGTVLQLLTPDHLRGRVTSVNNIFIGSSNELGAFESGTAAKLLGLIPSVVFGGVMTIAIAGIAAWKAPALWKLNLRKLQSMPASPGS